MDKTTDPQTADQKQTPADGNDFDKRHAKELGVGRFAKIQAAYMLIPLGLAAAGGALGHYALAKPLAKAIPRWNRALGAAEVMGSKALKFGGSLLSGNLTEAMAEFKASPEQAVALQRVWSATDISRDEKLAQMAETLNVPLPEVASSVRNTSTGVTAAVGGIGGSIAVGYDQWKKEESARLAAGEVNNDISKIELFKPSDSELVAENKRLRTMVAALPEASVENTSVSSQGKLAEKQQDMAMA